MIMLFELLIAVFVKYYNFIYVKIIILISIYLKLNIYEN